MKYVIYARVSTNYESQADSFETQQNEIQAKIKLLHPNYKLVGTYGDLGISGKKESRPEFQRMLKDARAKKFDCIITKSISRFARNTRLLLQALEELDKLGIKVLFLEENIDSTAPTQKFLLTVLGALAEMEAQNISAHIKESNSIRRVAGKATRACAVPLGYIWDPATKTVSVNPEEAELVNKIFHWYVDDNYSQGKIAALVVNSGFKPKRGGRRLDRGTITKILKNKKYIGIAVEKDASGKEFEFEGIFKPIIDRSLFDKAQTMIKVKKNPDYRRDTTRKLYPLSNLCYCACCDKKATRFTDLNKNVKAFEFSEPSSGFAYWGCKSLSTNKNSLSCITYKMSEQYIYEAIIEALVFAACGTNVGVSEGQLKTESFDRFITAIEESDKNYDSELHAYEECKKELEKQRKKELDLYRKEFISEAELEASLNEIKKQLSSLIPPKTPETKMMNKNHLNAFLKAVKNSDSDFISAQKNCREHLFELFKDADFRRSIVNTFVSKVWIGGDKFTVTVELQEPLVSYSHTFKSRAPIMRKGKVYRENYDF